MKKCGPDDWYKWANGLCDSNINSTINSTIKTKNFMKLQDWSWNQIDGFKGQDRVISKVPVVFMAQTYNGQIKSKTLQLMNNKVTLKQFVKKLESLFRNQNGDQSLTGIKKLGTQKEVLILWLMFES